MNRYECQQQVEMTFELLLLVPSLDVQSLGKIFHRLQGKTPSASFSFTFLSFLSICLFMNSICTHTWKFYAHINIHIFLHIMTKGNCIFFLSLSLSRSCFSFSFELFLWFQMNFLCILLSCSQRLKCLLEWFLFVLIFRCRKNKH